MAAPVLTPAAALAAATTPDNAQFLDVANGGRRVSADVLRAPISAEMDQKVEAARAALTALVQNAVDTAVEQVRVEQAAALAGQAASLHAEIAALQVSAGTPPSGSISGALTTRGVPGAFVVAFVAISSVWLCLEKDGVQEGARVQVTAPGVSPTLTSTTFGSGYKGVIYTAATGGTKLAETTAFSISAEALPALTITPVVGPLQISTSAVAAGATLATISGAAPGATLSLPEGETRVVLNGAKTALLVGAAALTTPGPMTVGVVQTLPGAINSPRTTTVVFTLTPAPANVTPANPLGYLEGGRIIAGGSVLIPGFASSPVVAGAASGTSGRTVSSLADQSVIAQVIGLGTNPNAPKYFQPGDEGFQAGYFNGRPYLSFDGNNQHLTSDTIRSASGAALIVAVIRRRANQPAEYGSPVSIIGNATTFNGLYPFLRTYLRPNGSFYGGSNAIETADVSMPMETACVIAIRRNADGTARVRVNDTLGAVVSGFPNVFPGKLSIGNSLEPGGGYNFTAAFELADLWVGDNLGDENLICAEFARLNGLKTQAAVDAAWTARQAAAITGTAEIEVPSGDGGETGGGTVTPVPAINTSYPVVAFAPIPLTLEGTGAPAGSIHTQMVEFQRGQVMPGDAISYKTVGGTKLATQYDVAPQTLFGDGSIRVTSLHIEGPTLADFAKDAGSIVKEATPTGTAINLATALSGRSCVVEIKNGGNVFSYDVIANLPAARWFQGNLKASTRAIVNIPRAAVGGGTGAKLQVDIAIDKAGVITCEPRVTNWSNYISNIGDAVYDYKLTGDGVVQASQTGVTTALGSSYGLERRWAPGGSARARPFYHKKDTAYISRTGILFNYDQTLGVDEALLAALASARAGGEWNAPNYHRDIKKEMGAPGAAPSIGYTTQPQAAWIISGDRRALEHINDQSEAAQTIPWHHTNPAYGDRWINSVDQPYGRATYHDGAFTTPSTVRNDTNGGWQLDEAHWGDMHLTSYLATGRRSCIDGLLGQASFAIMGRNAGGEREYPSATDADTEAGRAARLASIANDGKGANMRLHVQTRAYGWSTRQVLSAIAVVPASEQPHGDYFMRGQIGTFKTLLSEIPLATVNQKDAHGFPMDMDLAGSEFGHASPWQAVFVGSQLVRAARLEVPGAIEYLDWADNWYSGGFSHPDFNASDMTGYRLLLLQNGKVHATVNDTDWSTWAQMKAQLAFNFGPSMGANFDAPDAASQIAQIGDYQRRYWAFTTQLHDCLADFGKSTTKVAAASAFFANMPKPKTFSRASDFKNEAVNSIVRRGTTRVGVA